MYDRDPEGTATLIERLEAAPAVFASDDVYDDVTLMNESSAYSNWASGLPSDPGYPREWLGEDERARIAAGPYHRPRITTEEGGGSLRQIRMEDY